MIVEIGGRALIAGKNVNEMLENFERGAKSNCRFMGSFSGESRLDSGDGRQLPDPGRSRSGRWFIDRRAVWISGRLGGRASFV
jgi:hypothetical protein